MTKLECWLCRYAQKTIKEGSTWLGCTLTDILRDVDVVPHPNFMSYVIGHHCDYHKFAFGGENGHFTDKKEFAVILTTSEKARCRSDFLFPVLNQREKCVRCGQPLKHKHNTMRFLNE